MHQNAVRRLHSRYFPNPTMGRYVPSLNYHTTRLIVHSVACILRYSFCDPTRLRSEPKQVAGLTHLRPSSNTIDTQLCTFSLRNFLSPLKTHYQLASGHSRLNTCSIPAECRLQSSVASRAKSFLTLPLPSPSQSCKFLVVRCGSFLTLVQTYVLGHQ